MKTMVKTMRAVAIDRFGGPEVLSVREMPVRQPGKGEVLIQLDTVGVGSWDAEIRGGWSPSGKTPHFPLILGSDGAGSIAAVGDGVQDFEVGQNVYVFSWENPKGGFYAEYVVVPASTAAPVPQGLGLREAGAIPITGLTALQGINDTLKVQKGETVVIYGASGGVGTLALQFAKQRGARVFAVASQEDGVALTQRLGADQAVDGRDGEVGKLLNEFAPNGVDAVFTTANEPSLDICVAAIRQGGRLVYPNGVEPEPAKRKDVSAKSYDAKQGRAALEKLSQAVQGDGFHVAIAKEFTLDQTAQAHELVSNGHVLGKVVLRIR